MTKIEKELLRETIKKLIRRDKYLWWETKRQSYDFGFSTFVPRQYEYEQPARILLGNLSPEIKARLYLEALKRGRDSRNDMDAFIVNTYLSYVIDEIGRRAAIGAMKTIHW